MIKTHLTAREAADALGVSVTTLYAYVSRGRIRAEVLDGAKRTKRYSAEDVHRLIQRKEGRRDPDRAAKKSLNWGTPVLESAITLIRDNKLHYRGYDVEELARTCSVEQIAALIWTGQLPADPPGWFQDGPALPDACREALPRLKELRPVEACQALLPLAAAADLAGCNLQPEAVMRIGARILRLMTAVAAGTENMAGGLAAALAKAWRPDEPRAARLLASALILCADHELNVSAFTARCVASARANPYQVVLAGLAALQGAKHGMETERFAAFLREAGEPSRAKRAVAARLRRDERIPGFGHALYPEGDPRGRRLMEMAREAAPSAPTVQLVDALCQAVDELTGQKPNLDAGLTALAAALRLPEGSALTLFALGRSIGWIGQALETYAANQLIRPRARYTGEPPRPLANS